LFNFSSSISIASKSIWPSNEISSSISSNETKFGGQLVARIIGSGSNPSANSPMPYDCHSPPIGSWLSPVACRDTASGEGMSPLQGTNPQNSGVRCGNKSHVSAECGKQVVTRRCSDHTHGNVVNTRCTGLTAKQLSRW
jgi:hypothetical protein